MSEELVQDLRRGVQEHAPYEGHWNIGDADKLMDEAAGRIEELEQERDRLKGWWEVEQEKVIASQARLSEAVKVLEEASHLLQDVADGVMSADGRGDDGILDMQIVRDIEAFISTLGGEK